MDFQPWRAALRRHALIDHQLWFLGRDIIAADGNALIRYGFERVRSPDGNGSSAYLLPLAPDADTLGVRDCGVLICWGFAICAGTMELSHAVPGDELEPKCRSERRDESRWAGICLKRFRSTPGLVRAPRLTGVHQVTQLPRTITPRSHDDWAFTARTMVRVARTLADYERWVITTLGSAHRQAALNDAPRHKQLRFAPLTELSTPWESLAQSLGTPRHSIAA